jgi:methionine synthase II (cobalamin-independent)
MQRSVGRILTSHAGSLPRSPELVELFAEQPRGSTESFMTAPSPGIVACAMGSRDYERFEDYVEHPELVAERLERLADVVGDPQRIRAGTDLASRRLF